jgi:putative SOS response-associated peptidase YedK
MRRFVQAFDGDDLLPSCVPATLAQALAGLPQRYNIAAHAPAAVLYAHDGRLRVGQFRWGLVPRWSREPQTKYTTVTARLERAARSRIFRGPWETRRCVVPMNGYYKWDRSVKPPVPYFIHAHDGSALFAAGLWELWERDAPPLLSFAILTRPNDAIPPPLVPDGPVFLPAAHWEDWITQRPWFIAQRLAMLRQPTLAAYRVSRAIRDRDRDDYMLLEPVTGDDAVAHAEDGDAWDDDEA